MAYSTRYKQFGGANAENIGGNCGLVKVENSYGRQTSVLVDYGLMFPAPTNKMDALVPYVAEEEFANLHAILFTHAHKDHVDGFTKLIKYYRAKNLPLPPVYASKYVIEILKEGYYREEKLKYPYINREDVERDFPPFVEVKNYSEIDLGDIKFVPFNNSHSCADSMGFLVNTYDKGFQKTGMLFMGDYHLGEVKLGEGFNLQKFISMLQKYKLTTVFVDSTSGGTESVNLPIKQLADNMSEVIDSYMNGKLVNKYKHKRSAKKESSPLIFSPVISGSLENLVLVLDGMKVFADKQGMPDFKVFVDGFSNNLSVDIAKKCGILNVYKDYIFSGTASEYVDFAAQKNMPQFVIGTGAFAQEDKRGIFKSTAVKLAFDEHLVFSAKENSLIMLGQDFVIPSLLPKCKKMIEAFWDKGCVIIQNPKARNINLECRGVAKKQIGRSGHAGISPLLKLFKQIQANTSNKNFMCICVHGDEHQRKQTKEKLKSFGFSSVEVENGWALQLNADNVKRVEIEQPVWWGIEEQIATREDMEKNADTKSVVNYYKVLLQNGGKMQPLNKDGKPVLRLVMNQYYPQPKEKISQKKEYAFRVKGGDEDGVYVASVKSGKAKNNAKNQRKKNARKRQRQIELEREFKNSRYSKE